MPFKSSVDLLASRRSLFKSAAGASAIMALAASPSHLMSSANAADSKSAAPHNASTDLDWKNNERVSLGDGPLEDGKLGSLAALDVKALPLLKNVTLNIQRLSPGAAREPHWHHSVSELNCVLEGTGEMGIIGLDGILTRIPIEPGSVTFVPQGLTHYVANTGGTDLVMVMSFNSTRTTSSGLSNCLRAFPQDRFAQMTGLAAAEITTPGDEGALTYTKIEALPEIKPSSSYLVDGAVSSINFSAIPGFASEYATGKDVDAKIMGQLDGISMSLMTVEPGAMRDLHWHPHGTELVYIVAGELEIGLQAPGKAGDSSVFTAGQGQAVALPEGWLHYAANTGSETARLIVVWESTQPKSVEVMSMLSVLPTELTMASAGSMLNATQAKALLGKPVRAISPRP